MGSLGPVWIFFHHSSLITPHSIFVTHQSSLKIPKLSQSHPFGTHHPVLCSVVSVWIEMNVVFSVSRFPFFFFFLRVNSNLTWVHCSRTVYHCSCTVHHCLCTVHALKNIKNGSHGTIHTFKNYFATVLSVFSFSNNKPNPNGPFVSKKKKVQHCSWIVGLLQKCHWK